MRTGRDTTSAIFTRGKTAVFKLFAKCNDLIDKVKIFANIDSSADVILTNGFRIFNGARKKIESIGNYRFLNFVNKRMQLSSFPPTSASTYQDLFPMFYQVQVWLGNKLNPESWG